jgi:hypothetical protein
MTNRGGASAAHEDHDWQEKLNQEAHYQEVKEDGEEDDEDALQNKRLDREISDVIDFLGKIKSSDV